MQIGICINQKWTKADVSTFAMANKKKLSQSNDAAGDESKRRDAVIASERYRL